MRGFCALLLVLMACDRPAPAAQNPDPTDAAPPRPSVGDQDPGGEDGSPPASGQDVYALPSDAPGNDAACDQRRKFAIAFLATARDHASSGCSEHTDCALVQGGSDCMGGCKAGVLAARAELFTSAREAVNRDVCEGYFTEDRCPYAGPRCANVEARCNDGRCTAGQKL